METEKILRFNVLAQTVRANQEILVPQFCNSLTVINYGTSIITINGTWVLYPGTPGTNSGESVSFGGNRLEILKQRFDINFNTGVGTAGVAFKTYLPENFDEL